MEQEQGGILGEEYLIYYSKLRKQGKIAPFVCAHDIILLFGSQAMFVGRCNHCQSIFDLWRFCKYFALNVHYKAAWEYESKNYVLKSEDSSNRNWLFSESMESDWNRPTFRVRLIEVHFPQISPSHSNLDFLGPDPAGRVERIERIEKALFENDIQLWRKRSPESNGSRFPPRAKKCEQVFGS